jgi:hypothetical protein
VCTKVLLFHAYPPCQSDGNGGVDGDGNGDDDNDGDGTFPPQVAASFSSPVESEVPIWAAMPYVPITVYQFCFLSV